jgi:hypothetical protein
LSRGHTPLYTNNYENTEEEPAGKQKKTPITLTDKDTFPQAVIDGTTTACGINYIVNIVYPACFFSIMVRMENMIYIPKILPAVADSVH